MDRLEDIMEDLGVPLGGITGDLVVPLWGIMEDLEVPLGGIMEDLEVLLGYTMECQGGIMEDLGALLLSIKEGWGCPLEGMWEALVDRPLDVLEVRGVLVQWSTANTQINRREEASGRVAERWM